MTTIAPLAGAVVNVTVPPAGNPPAAAGVTVNPLVCSTLLILGSMSLAFDTANVKVNAFCKPFPMNVLVLAGRRMVSRDPDGGAGNVGLIKTVPPELKPPAAGATV
jgi:hypothetical protein